MVKPSIQAKIRMFGIFEKDCSKQPLRNKFDLSP